MTAFESTINGIINKAKLPDAGDYIGDDGLLYCCKCNTRKQTRVTLFGSERTVPCICQCEAAEIKRQDDERKMREHERVLREMRKTGFPEREMENWNFAADDGSNPQLLTVMHNYVDKFDTFQAQGKGLLFYGNVGTGKTFAAACIANALIDKGVPVLMTNFARLANTLQGMYDGKQEYIDGLNRFSLLVIDDLAAERRTEWMQEIVFNVIDARYRSGKPMIITTNLSMEKLKSADDAADQRRNDRILEKCFPVEVNGISHRRKKIVQEYQATKEMLGL